MEPLFTVFFKYRLGLSRTAAWREQAKEP